jgi:hypothetical protein
MDRHVIVIHTCDNRDAVVGQHHRWDHAQGGARRRGEWVPHSQGVV